MSHCAARALNRALLVAACGLAIGLAEPGGAALAGGIGTFGPYDVTVKSAFKYAHPAADTLIECKPAARSGHFAGPFPAIMLIHGGGWSGGTSAVGPGYTGYSGSWCELWASWGFTAFSVGYRLTGEASWPAQIVDVQAAIRWVRANADGLGINPGMIVVNGDSAGGQLAMVAGYSWSNIPGDLAGDNSTMNPQPELVISQFGPWTFGPGSNPSSRAEDYAAQILLDSADERTEATTPKTLFLQGTQDTTVNQCSQSEAAYRFLVSNQRPADYISYNGGHEFTNMDPDTWASVVGYLQTQTISFAYDKAHSEGILPASEAGPGLDFDSNTLPVGCP